MTFKELKDHLEIINRYGVEALTISTSDLTELVKDVEGTLIELNEAIAPEADEVEYLQDDTPDEDADYMWHLHLLEGDDVIYHLND